MPPHSARLGRLIRANRLLHSSAKAVSSPPIVSLREVASRAAITSIRPHPDLISLQRAIANANVNAAREHISFFLTKERVDLLQPRHLHDICGFLHKNHEVRTELGVDALVLLALRGQTEFVNFAMRSAINEGRPEAVVYLWERVHSSLTESPRAEEPSLSSHLANSLSDLAIKNLKRPMAYTVLALALQHGLTNSTIRLFLGLPVTLRITPDELDRFAFQSTNVGSLPSSSAPSPPPTALRILKSITAVRLLEHPREALAFLQEAFNAGDVDTVLETMGILIDGAKSSPPWVAPTTSLEWTGGKSAAVRMTESMWSLAMAGLIKAGHVDAARSLWNEMTNLEVPQTTVSWNALLDGYGRRGNIEDVMKIWDGMERSGIQKDHYSYTTVISALFQSKNADRALELFRESTVLFEDQSSPQTSNPISETIDSTTAAPFTLSPSPIVTYNAVLHGLLISARSAEAEQLFEDMRTRGPYPDITSFNTLIRHYGRKGDTKRIATLLRCLPELKIKPDVITFTSVLHAALRSGVSTQEAIKTVEAAMQGAGVEPNVVTYTAIIDQVLREGGEDSLGAAFEWLDAMQRRGLHANEVTYTAILSALQKDASLDPTHVRTQSQAIVSRMQANGAKMNRVTFHILLHAALSGDKGVEGLMSAVQVYGQMVKQGLQGNADTWYMLLRGVVDSNSWALGGKLLEEMKKVGFIPQGRVANLARRIQMHL